MGKKVGLCVTSIFDMSVFIEEFSTNIQKFGHENEVTIYIAGDNKTPANTVELAKDATNKTGVNIEFLSIEWQREYLKKFNSLESVIPENTDNRRNVAFLKALEDGIEILLSMDDDNYPVEVNEIDFVGAHQVVGEELTLPTAVGFNRWFNLCSMLEPKDKMLYARGFPYNRRDLACADKGPEETIKVGINVGVWKNAPDCDAIARLHCRPKIADWTGEELALAKGVLTPINTQNTAMRREAVASYYYVRMGENIGGMLLDRFGDIFSGYFLQLCAGAVGDRIKIGGPLADHRRNEHNIFKDLYNELAGIVVLEDLCSFFEGVKLDSSSYANAYVDLANQMRDFTRSQSGFLWNEKTHAYFDSVSNYMVAWTEACKLIGV